MDPLSAFETNLRVRWESAHGKSECRLERLKILREIYKSIHTLKSSRSTAVLDHLSTYQQFNESILLAAKSSLESLSWDQLRKPTQSKNIPARTLHPIAEHLKPKLDRFDRVFEREMAIEALRLGWKIGYIDYSLKLEDINSFFSDLEEGKNHCFLFSEAAPLETQAPAGHWMARLWFATQNLTDLEVKFSAIFHDA